tara:strand:- start:1142 stop:1456 length:315 start_codon:yes stop_codon:yes gene_type:complete
MDFDLNEEQIIPRDNLRKMMDHIATPEYLREHDESGLYPYEVYEKWVEMGLLGLPFPEQYGVMGEALLTWLYAASLPRCAEHYDRGGYFANAAQPYRQYHGVEG